MEDSDSGPSCHWWAGNLGTSIGGLRGEAWLPMELRGLSGIIVWLTVWVFPKGPCVGGLLPEVLGWWLMD